jgi:hypothetical protein
MYLTTMKRATPGLLTRYFRSLFSNISAHSSAQQMKNILLPRYFRSFSNISDHSSAQQMKNEIASDILENISLMRRRQVVKLSAVFPKMTDAMKAEDSVIEDVYYDDLSFRECVLRARSSTELAALGIGSSVGGVLDVLASKPSDFEVHAVVSCSQAS